MKPIRTKIIWHYPVYSMCAAFLLMFSSCEKDNNNNNITALTIDGFWIVDETVTDNCSGITETGQQTEIFSVEQHNNDLTVTLYPNGDVVNGTINHSNITWEGTLPSGSGQLDIDFTGTVSGNGNQIHGTADWIWHSDSYQCSGTTVMSGNKVLEESLNFEGEWNGTWESEDYSYEGIFSANVTQVNSLLSGTISVPEIGMYDAALEGIISGNVVYFGDIDEIIQFVGILENNTATGTYSYMSSTDEGSWIAERD